LAEITALIDEARSGGRAATSVGTCLDHLHKGRVEKLYVCSDLDLSGYSDATGRLSLHPPSDAEQSLIQPESRLAERMIVQAIESGATVIPIEGESARKLSLLGGVAARLRWKDVAISRD
jgi:peptide subunit release factor 1 (eRF1)